MTRPWSKPADITARVRRRWESGALLRAHALGEPFEPITVALRGPSVGQIGDDLVAVRDWIADLEADSRDSSRYLLRWRAVGGRSIGRNELPSHAVVDRYEQAWALLGVARQVLLFEELLQQAGERQGVRDWLLARPLQALELAGEMLPLLAAYDWFQTNRGSGAFLRQISAPGVDTKFAERHRAVLARMLGVPSQPADFLQALGLRAAPAMLQFRPAPGNSLIPGISELAVRLDELTEFPAPAGPVLVVENKVTYLSVPVPDAGLVIWGAGFDVVKLTRLPWLADARILYWGDLDPHGFVILDLLRRGLPKVESVLMDRETLLRHEQRWVRERTASPMKELPSLTEDEARLYRDLVEDRMGPGVRLEQERIDWDWAMSRLRAQLGGSSS